MKVGIVLFTALIAAAPAAGLAAPSSIEPENPALVQQRLVEQAQPRSEVAIDAALLDKYAGYYQLAPNVVLGFSRDGDHLRATRNGKILPALFAESDHKFFFKMIDAQISFESGQAVLHQGGHERTAARIDETLARDIQKKADSAHVFMGGGQRPGPLGARTPID